MKIEFLPMQTSHFPLWQAWIQKPHVKEVWFIEGYEPSDYVYKKIAGNGYDYPFIISIDDTLIGYIQCCDLYAYRMQCPKPKGLFTEEAPGTFCMDLFIADESYLDKGYGTQVVKAFSEYIFTRFNATKILIDPASNNKRAIRCYEKAGFHFVKEAFDGVTQCTILEKYRLQLPEEFIKNITAIYGKTGKDWLKNLPTFLSDCEHDWHLSLAPCYKDLSFNYVAPAWLLDHTSAVLKCSPPNKEFDTEVAALQHFNGLGAVTLLREDATTGKMLIEQITPGHSLEKLNHTQEAVEASVTVMNQLHKPIAYAHEFPNLHQWFQGFPRLRQTFHGGTGPFSSALIDRAEKISNELLSSMGEQVLLHGDLHYGNILFSNERGWLAIDPKGVIGEREFEIPLPKLNEGFTKKQLENNLRWLIEATGFDQQRILRWLFSKAMLAAWWCFEDQGSVGKKFIACAEIVQTLKL